MLWIELIDDSGSIQLEEEVENGEDIVETDDSGSNSTADMLRYLKFIKFIYSFSAEELLNDPQKRDFLKKYLESQVFIL